MCVCVGGKHVYYVCVYAMFVYILVGVCHSSKGGQRTTLSCCSPPLSCLTGWPRGLRHAGRAWLGPLWLHAFISEMIYLQVCWGPGHIEPTHGQAPRPHPWGSAALGAAHSMCTFSISTPQSLRSALPTHGVKICMSWLSMKPNTDLWLIFSFVKRQSISLLTC